MTLDRTPSPILQRVRQACDEVARLAGASLAGELADVRGLLNEVLRVAVVGRVKAGKSTLVNALVGRAVAPTAAGECTRVVTWYRYGAPDRAEVELLSGERRILPIVDGLPDDVGVPPEAVKRIVVHLQSGRLRNITLIDTPGLATLTGVNEAATRTALLGDIALSQRATGQADAVIFVFREAERQDEVAFLRDFRDASGDLSASAANAIGVLSQADLFGAGPWSGDDPFLMARDRSVRLAAARSAEVSAVLPMSGLLAETARTGRFREQDARVLHSLQGHDPTRLQLWEHLGPPDGVEANALRRLFALVGPYGVAAGRHHAAGGASDVLAWLEKVSGVVDVEDTLQRQLVNRADILKASHALGDLDRAAARAPHPAAVREVLEDARLDPIMHPLRELRALVLLTRDVPTSPLRALLEKLTAGGDDRTRAGLAPGTSRTDLGQQARAAAARAQAAATTAASPQEAEAGRVVALSFQLIARRAEMGS